MHHLSLFLLFFHFHNRLFRGVAGACVNPRKLFLFINSFVCQITHSQSLLMDFSQTCISTSPMYVVPACIFSLNKTLEFMHLRKAVTLQADASYHNLNLGYGIYARIILSIRFGPEL